MRPSDGLGTWRTARRAALTAVVALAVSADSDTDDRSTYHAGRQVWSIEFADLDADGAPEMIATNGIDGAISIFRGKTGQDLGAFDERSTISGGLNYPFASASGDFDLDGNMDFAVACYQRLFAIEVYFGDGSGEFRQAKYSSSPWRSRLRADLYPRRIFATDVNRDGRLDLVVANQEPGGYTVYLNDGGRAFVTNRGDAVSMRPQQVRTGDVVYGAAMGDLDRDGLPDLVVANWKSDVVTIHLNQGDGTFGTADTAKAIRFALPYAVALGDFDADGVLDLAVDGGPPVGTGPTERALYRGDGHGAFDRVWSDATLGNLVNLVALADMDGDGRDDLIVSNAPNAPHGNKVQVLFSQGMTSDGSAALFDLPQPLPTAGDHAFALAVADLDRDGKLDLAVGSMNVLADPSTAWIALVLSGRAVGFGGVPGRAPRLARSAGR